jgi:hypothetical protein
MAPPRQPPGDEKRAGISPTFVYAVAAFVAIAAAVATAGAFVLFSGDDDEPAEPQPTATVEATATTGGSPTPEPSATTPALPGETRDNPLGVGVTRRGFDGWEIYVVRSDFDVVQEVMAENPNNEPPRDGWTFALVRISATNREAEPDEGEETSEYRPFAMALIDGDGTEYFTFENDGCGVIPDGFAFIFGPQPRGGTVEGNICFHVPQESAGEFVLFDDGSDTWFALR